MPYKTPGTIAMREVTTFKNMDVQLTSGGSFNQKKTIDRIIKYTRSEFWEYSGTDAIFRNISNQRIPIYAKSIDMDSKEFYTYGTGDTNWYQNWVLNVRFKKWVRDNRFSLTLDDTSTSIATFGSSVWKECKDLDGNTTIKESDIRNLYFDPTVKNIIDSPVVELHYLSEMQIRKRWKDKADDIIAVAKKARDDEGNESETEDPKYIIWERHGELLGGDNVLRYMRNIGAGEGDGEVDIYSKELKFNNKNEPIDFPYFDFHGERVKGRWLGIGVVERLFHLQEEMNTLVNQNAEAQNISSLLLFRTEDPNVTGNILDQARSGQILNSPDLQQLGIDNRFLNEFLNQVRLINEQADALCYIQDSLTGKTPPSGVPFRSVAMASRGAVSTFDYIKTHIGEKMGIVLQEVLLPALIKKFNREDAVEIADDEFDINAFDEALVFNATQNYKKLMASQGRVVFEEDLAELQAMVLDDVQRNRRLEKHGKDFFNFDYGVSMNPTGESMDKIAMNEALDGILSIMAATPQLVDTMPFKKKVSINGIPPFKLSQKQLEAIQNNTNPTPVPDKPQDKLSAKAAV